MHYQIVMYSVKPPEGALFGQIVEYSFRSAQYPGPMLYVSHVEKYVSYVAVHFFVRSFDNAIFLLRVRDRSMVCDPCLKVKV